MSYFEIFTICYTIPLSVIVVILSLNLVKANKKIKDKNDQLNISDERYTQIYSQKKSSEVRLGQIAENFAPLIQQFPYNPKRARFIGYPIDLVVFEDNEIIFVEVKTGESRLNPNQKKVKELVEAGAITWKEIRLQ